MRDDPEMNANISSEEMLKLILNNNEKSTGLKIPTSTLMTIIVILCQIVAMIFMFTLSEKMEKYDAYGDRLTNVETALVRFEPIARDLESLIKDFEQFSSEPRFSFNEFNRGLEPVKSQLNRMEISMEKKFDAVEEDYNGKIGIVREVLNTRTDFMEKTDKGIDELRFDVEIIKRELNKK